MAIIKCKMCGGDIELSADKTFGTCECCGSSMTFPKVDDEQRAAAFNRGNHFRRIGEFDKALQVYERIVREDENDAEAHWCCALCRFGIEYVEDPATYEWLPTCHRASFDSFLEDVDYLAAVEHSDGITRRQYQKDGAKIAEVQRGILATSQNAEPYDVFICYKETDADGGRTKDSMLAQDIYYQLTEQGRKVFFARITLEDVVGTQYEPYIFAALNSAKVMIVVGTKPEHLNAVWVKNEWSRFLAMMKKDHSKLLLPCYRDMDPYDLPEQLSVLQSYDMGKIGFIQDLIRGVSKVLDADKKPAPVKETVVVQSGGGANTAPLLKRAFMFLEDGDWQSANEYCEKVLDIDPENADAYLGKLMVDLKVPQKEKLKDCQNPFDNNANYEKALRFGNDAFKKELTGCIEYIIKRNFDAKNANTYRHAMFLMSNAKSTDAKTYLDARALLQTLPQDYKENLADEIIHCGQKAEECRKNKIYQSAKHLMLQETVDSYQSAIRELQKISGWQDADQRINTCRAAIEKLNQEQEKEELERVKHLKRVNISICAIVAMVLLALLITQVFIPNGKYNKAVKLMDAGKYEEAIVAFAELDGYKNSDAQITACKVAILEEKYNAAVALMQAGKYDEAITAFGEVQGYKDTSNQIASCRTALTDQKYNDAVALMDAGKSLDAITVFRLIGDYQDSIQRIRQLLAQKNTIFAGDSHTVGLKANGTVVAVGNSNQNRCNVAGWTNIVAIAAGELHTVGLKADGTVVAVGYNVDGQCDVDQWTDIVAIAAGANHTVGLKADGTVVAVGYNVDGQCNVNIIGWTDIVAIAAGANHTVGLKADGTVVAVGKSAFGQRDVSDWTDIVAISAGSYHTVGLKADGTVVAVGLQDYDQCNVTDWKDIVAVSAGYYHTVGLKTDGTVVAVGSNSTTDYDGRCDVTGWTDIVAIAAGFMHTVGLKADGTVVAMGANDDGQCNVDLWIGIKLPE